MSSKLKNSHFNEVIKPASKGNLTYYYFDVWNLEITEEVFNIIKNNKNIALIKNEKLNSKKYEIQDHVKFLFKEIPLKGTLPGGIEEIRISIAGIVNIKFKNYSILFKEDKKVKPFGGAYLFKKGFLEKFPFVKLDKPDSKDLRFKIPIEELENIKNWIKTEENRETHPTRELFEEFCLENEILCKTLFNKLIF